MKTKATAKAIVQKMWAKAPEEARRSASAAIIMSMAATMLSAEPMQTDADEAGKTAIRDMAHEVCYNWDPFDGLLA